MGFEVRGRAVNISRQRSHSERYWKTGRKHCIFREVWTELVRLYSGPRSVPPFSWILAALEVWLLTSISLVDAIPRPQILENLSARGYAGICAAAQWLEDTSTRWGDAEMRLIRRALGLGLALGSVPASVAWQAYMARQHRMLLRDLAILDWSDDSRPGWVQCCYVIGRDIVQRWYRILRGEVPKSLSMRRHRIITERNLEPLLEEDEAVALCHSSSSGHAPSAVPTSSGGRALCTVLNSQANEQEIGKVCHKGIVSHNPIHFTTSSRILWTPEFQRDAFSPAAQHEPPLGYVQSESWALLLHLYKTVFNILLLIPFFLMVVFRSDEGKKIEKNNIFNNTFYGESNKKPMKLKIKQANRCGIEFNDFHRNRFQQSTAASVKFKRKVKRKCNKEKNVFQKSEFIEPTLSDYEEEAFLSLSQDEIYAQTLDYKEFFTLEKQNGEDTDIEIFHDTFEPLETLRSHNLNEQIIVPTHHSVSDSDNEIIFENCIADTNQRDSTSLEENIQLEQDNKDSNSSEDAPSTYNNHQPVETSTNELYTISSNENLDTKLEAQSSALPDRIYVEQSTEIIKPILLDVDVGQNIYSKTNLLESKKNFTHNSLTFLGNGSENGSNVDIIASVKHDHFQNTSDNKISDRSSKGNSLDLDTGLQNTFYEEKGAQSSYNETFDKLKNHVKRGLSRGKTFIILKEAEIFSNLQENSCDNMGEKDSNISETNDVTNYIINVGHEDTHSKQFNSTDSKGQLTCISNAINSDNIPFACEQMKKNEMNKNSIRFRSKFKSYENKSTKTSKNIVACNRGTKDKLSTNKISNKGRQKFFHKKTTPPRFDSLGSHSQVSRKEYPKTGKRRALSSPPADGQLPHSPWRQCCARHDSDSNVPLAPDTK